MGEQETRVNRRNAGAAASRGEFSEIAKERERGVVIILIDGNDTSGLTSLLWRGDSKAEDFYRAFSFEMPLRKYVSSND